MFMHIFLFILNLSWQMTKKRKLGGSYISFDFICIAKCDGAQKPDCFLCGKFPANKSLKSRKLISEHPENTSQNIEFLFSTEKAQFLKSENLLKLIFAPVCLDTFPSKRKH